MRAQAPRDAADTAVDAAAPAELIPVQEFSGTVEPLQRPNGNCSEQF